MAYLKLKKGSGARRPIQYSDHSSDSNEKNTRKASRCNRFRGRGAAACLVFLIVAAVLRGGAHMVVNQSSTGCKFSIQEACFTSTGISSETDLPVSGTAITST
jgi:hypothetical protein